MTHDAVHYPDQTRCVECDQLLPRGTIECKDCYAAAQPLPESAAHRRIERLLRRTKARLLFGIALFGIVLPWAYLSAKRAIEIYHRGQLDEPRLLRRIRSHQNFAVLTLLGWGFWLALQAYLWLR